MPGPSGRSDPEAMNTTTTNQSDSTTGSSRSVPARPPLRRSTSDRMLTGTASGIARYLGVDSAFVRMAFVAATLMGGAGVLLYLAALLLIPEEGSD
jgi:phage shock protein PspC (stress-responsive transcriptional regulator)